ncbi:hypothetical protein [Mycolicibacterium confluentis]|uniref:Uncharacterized protein n=1 Tax=Mycolicibacterium confluentis TaxID=28047 RepID=A0A7I7Y699_9MYCO|nr:hypothetical protein [Mycolicibacterium confluentis]MCV7319210.1 hypothetical protein [Mycolicibacterium confluentis]ORV24920.1 hypothetical protein AWB99_05410 [Mycolicibacterium confluentis]BBZ36824.1 hypothetical protein MCNF_54290 [Mycolicibacterium confluentis]
MSVTIRQYFCDPRGQNFVPMTPGMSYTFPNRDYIDGALELTVNWVPIFDKSMWDLIDVLWHYILGMLDRLESSDRVEGQFPDQPLKFVFERIRPGVLRVTSNPGPDRRTAVVDEEKFVDALRQAAAEFLRVMDEL